MSSNFVQSTVLRSIALRAVRTAARAQFWRTGPRVFVNSIPKAGTHLLTSELDRITPLQNCRLHLNAAQLGTNDAADGGAPSINKESLSHQIGTVRGSQYFTGHLPWSVELQSVLSSADISSIFILRDPRDILVSRYHYVTALRRHHLHDFLTSVSDKPVDVYRKLVLGHEGAPFIRPMRHMLRQYLPWQAASGVLTVRFEDLVGARGGGNDAIKQLWLEKIAGHIGVALNNRQFEPSAPPKKTPTLRKGKAGAWSDELPSEIASLIDEECGPEMMAIGYP